MPTTNTTAPTTKRAPSPRTRAKTGQAQVVTAAGSAGRVYGPNDLQAVTYPTDRVLPVLSFSVYGLPAPQGSKKIKYIKGKPVPVEVSDKLDPWRDAVKKMAHQAIIHHEKRTGRAWKALAEPVFITVTITLPSSAAAEKRGDVYACSPPDADKLMRAIGDSISPKPLSPNDGKGHSDAVRKRIREEMMENRRRVSIMHDDSYIMWAPAVKVYPKKTPTALEHPGAVVQIWRMAELDYYRVRPVFNLPDGTQWGRLDDLRRWVKPEGKSWEAATRRVFDGELQDAAGDSSPVVIRSRTVSDEDAARLMWSLMVQGPDAWVQVRVAD